MNKPGTPSKERTIYVWPHLILAIVGLAACAFGAHAITRPTTEPQAPTPKAEATAEKTPVTPPKEINDLKDGLQTTDKQIGQLITVIESLKAELTALKTEHNALVQTGLVQRINNLEKALAKVITEQERSAKQNPNAIIEVPPPAWSGTK